MVERFEFFRPKKGLKKRPIGPSFRQKYGPHWEALRRKILIRDNWQCQICGRVCQDKFEAQVDHKVRKGLQGDDSEANLWVLCSLCHGRKSRREQLFG